MHYVLSIFSVFLALGAPIHVWAHNIVLCRLLLLLVLICILYFCVFVFLVWLLLLLFQEAVGTMCGPGPSLQTDYRLRRLTLAG